MSLKRRKPNLPERAEALADECCRTGEIPEDLEPQELAYMLRQLVKGYRVEGTPAATVDPV
jgi:hypothetical protein